MDISNFLPIFATKYKTKMTKLSIIVPVYNVEKYIRPCIESIFKQGLDDADYEVIIINDGTKDRSMEVISDIISQHNNITIINQENQGLSVARNNGIAVAQGEYILMPDSDDLLIENSLPPLLEKALETKVDIVVADFIPVEDVNINQLSKIIQKPLSFQEKNGEQLFLEDLNPRQCYVWRSLFRRQYIIDNNFKFVPGIFYQDVPFTHECYIRAQKCLRANWYLNIYRRNRMGAATVSFNPKKSRDFCTTIAKTWELTKTSGLSPMIEQKLKQDIWTSFALMLRLTCDHIKNDLERIDTIDYLRQIAPDLSFTNGKRQRAATLLYRKMPHTFIRLRYLYGKIIEERIMPFYRHWLRRPFSKK